MRFMLLIVIKKNVSTFVLAFFIMKNISLKLIVFLSIISVLASCNSNKSVKPNFDITLKNKVEVNIHRYEKALFGIDTADFQNGLKGIQKEFLPFLSANLDDTANVNNCINLSAIRN